MNDIHTQCNNNAIKSLKRQNQRILQKSLTNCSNILPDDSIQCSPNGDAGPPTKRLSGTKVDPTTNGVGQTSKPADYCQKERERESQTGSQRTNTIIQSNKTTMFCLASTHGRPVVVGFVIEFGVHCSVVAVFLLFLLLLLLPLRPFCTDVIGQSKAKHTNTDRQLNERGGALYCNLSELRASRWRAK